MRFTFPAGSGPGSAVKKRIATGWRFFGAASSSVHGLAERAQRDLDEVDADGVLHEIGHLAAGDPRRHLDDGDATVRERR